MQQQTELNFIIFIPTPTPQRLIIPIDVSRLNGYNSIEKVQKFIEENSTEKMTMVLNGMLPETPENIQIERDQENKLSNQ